MKRIGSMTILLAILAMPAQAQRQGRMRGAAGPDEFANRQRTREISADVIIRLRDRLDLSEDQLERIKAAQGADREVRDALRLDARAMRDRLRDDEITRQEFREEMRSRRSAEMDGMRAYRETLEGILTDEQRSQMRRFRRQMNQRQGVRSGRSARPSARPGARDRGQGSRGSRAQRGGRNMRPERGGRTFGPPGDFGPRLRRGR